MTWICPYCGTENHRDPLNSRHWVKCKECGNGKAAPEDLEAERAEELKQLETELRRANWAISPIVDRLSSYRQEVIDLEMELKEQKEEAARVQASIDVLRAKPIFREVDRASKVRLDRMQQMLPFEEVPACA